MMTMIMMTRRSLSCKAGQVQNIRQFHIKSADSSRKDLLRILQKRKSPEPIQKEKKMNKKEEIDISSHPKPSDTEPSNTATTKYGKWEGTEPIVHEPDELGHDFDFESFIEKDEKRRKEAPPRQGSVVAKPSLSQATKPRYQKNPYKIDSKGAPLYDFQRLGAFNKARYPGIEVHQIYIPKRPTYEYRVKTEEEAMKHFEFRCGITSDEILRAGANVENVPGNEDDKTYLIAKAFGWQNASKHELHKLELQKACFRFGISPLDTGSLPVQVAVLTGKIKFMVEHLQANRQDKRTYRAMHTATARRNRLLQKLRHNDPEKYWKLMRHVDFRIKI